MKLSDVDIILSCLRRCRASKELIDEVQDIYLRGVEAHNKHELQLLKIAVHPIPIIAIDCR